MHSILLVDDKLSVIEELAASLRQILASEEVEIREWVPTREEPNAFEAFGAKVDEGTTLVITDSDLTSQGQMGLFGASVVSWCQQRALPVGDYSRLPALLPKAPELFELRIPSDPTEAPAVIAALFKGFRDIDNLVRSREEILTKRSPAAVLASLLGKPEIEGQLALYAVRISATSGALVDRVGKEDTSPEHKRKLLSYITGHLLLNVLRFPGPILSLRALKAYVASDEAGATEVVTLFSQARYSGPFSDLDQYFWLSGIDAVLDELTKALPAGYQAETSGELYREALERALSRPLLRHSCPMRCQGKNGGFFCPFTSQTVCQLPKCSVGPNSWIPQGAKICRIERDFFEEWSPILGL